MFETAAIRWKKLGLVLRPDRRLPWAQTHCMVPTPQMLNDGLVRIYFSGRDETNRSNIGYAVVDLNAGGKVLEYSSRPVLTPGELGCFDDNGVTPSSATEIDGRLHLYIWVGTLARRFACICSVAWRSARRAARHLPAGRARRSWSGVQPILS